jgi:hypothetical protein
MVYDTLHPAVAGNNADSATDHERKKNDRAMVCICKCIEDVNLEGIQQAMPQAGQAKAVNGPGSYPDACKQGRNNLA